MNTARQWTTDEEPMTRKKVTPQQIIEGWRRTSARFTQSRSRGLACHNLRHNLSVASIPATWGTQEDRDQIASCLPERQLVEQGIINNLSEYWPVYRRQAIGAPTPTKTRAAGKLERWLEGCDEEQMDHDLIWLKGGEDGEFAYVLLPDLADFHRGQSYSDEIDDKTFNKLRDDARRGWRRDGDSGTWKRPKKRYWRDGFKRPTDDYDKAHAKATRESYDDEVNTLGGRLPWVERLISMYDCAPVLVKGRGRKRYECRGLYVRTLYDVDELMTDGWQWIGMGNRGLVPRGFKRNENSHGANGQIYLYEYYFVDMVEEKDERGIETLVTHPCVAYSVAGLGTARGEDAAEDECAVIDLREHFGIDEPTWDYFYGMHTGSDDPDFIGRPILWPLLATITNLEKIVTAKNAYDFKVGFPGYVMPADPNMSEAMQKAMMDGADLATFEVPEADEIKAMPAPVVPFQAARSGDGLNDGISFHSDRLQRNKPQGDPSQKQNGASGNAMLVGEDLEQQAHRHLKECTRQVHEFAGRIRIKFGCAFARKFDIKTPVEANLERAADESENARGLMEFDERWVADVYKITSAWPKVGNLAEAQQYADFEERGLVLWEEFREKLGDEDPENSKLKRDVENYEKSPPAMLRLDRDVAQMLNDAEEAARLQAELDGLINPEGVPPDAIAPEFAGMAGGAPIGAQMPGVAMPNIPASVLGGTVAAPMGQAAAMAEAQSMAQIPGGM